MNDSSELKAELRQGSEARHYINRHTPDGKESVEAIPLEWAIEVLLAERQKAQLELLDRLEKICNSVEQYNQQVHGRSDCKSCTMVETIRNLLNEMAIGKS